MSIRCWICVSCKRLFLERAVSALCVSGSKNGFNIYIYLLEWCIVRQNTWLNMNMEFSILNQLTKEFKEFDYFFLFGLMAQFFYTQELFVIRRYGIKFPSQIPCNFKQIKFRISLLESHDCSVPAEANASFFFANDDKQPHFVTFWCNTEKTWKISGQTFFFGTAFKNISYLYVAFSAYV